MLQFLSHQLLSFRTGIFHSNTCTHDSLLGPCFKTGDISPFRQHPKQADGDNFAEPPRNAHCKQIYTLGHPGPSPSSPRHLFCLPQSKLPYATRVYNSHPLLDNPPYSNLSPPILTDVGSWKSKVPPFSRKFGQS